MMGEQSFFFPNLSSKPYKRWRHFSLYSLTQDLKSILITHTHIPALLQTLVGLKPYRLYPIPTLHIYFKDECWKYDLCHSFNAFSDRHLHHFCTWRASVVESRKKELRVQALPKWRLLHRQGPVGKRISLQLPRPIHWTLVRVSYKISGELRFPSSWQLS